MKKFSKKLQNNVVLLGAFLCFQACQLEEPIIPVQTVQEQQSPDVPSSGTQSEPITPPQTVQEQQQAPNISSSNTQPEQENVTDTASSSNVFQGVPTPVKIQFDSTWGSFYPENGKPTGNPINITANTGEFLVAPQNSANYKAIPYREGYQFKGWVLDYPYEGLIFEEKDFWDFETRIIIEQTTLYAYYEQTDTPDSEPPINKGSSVPNYNTTSKLVDYHVEDVPPLSILTTKNNEGRYEFFAKGVNQDHGWLNNVQYKNNCSATSASQMIYWYHERIKELTEGFSPSETPIITDDKVLALRNYFGDWMEFNGAQIVWALEKYFTENLDDHRMKDIVSYHCSNGSYFTLGSLSKILLKHLSRGDMCGLTAVNFDGGLHAMNIYGAEFNEQGTVEVIYVTSSPTLESEEQIKQYTPRLYKFYRDGESKEGAANWKATYESRELGYVTTSQSIIRNIYRLDFLTLEQYK